MTTWALIPCTKSKQPYRCPAGEMYMRSQLFRGALATAQAQGQEVIILSAKHGAISPTVMIDPYDETLKGAPKDVKIAWTYGVLNTLINTIHASTDRVISYLGRDYAEYLLPELRELGIPVEEPLKGLGQGKRLKWFKERRSA